MGQRWNQRENQKNILKQKETQNTKTYGMQQKQFLEGSLLVIQAYLKNKKNLKYTI